MRSILFVALVTLPGLAAAQTPRDLARLTWPLGAPAVTAQAREAVAGAASGTDLARLAGVSAARDGEYSAPAAEPAGAVTATSLANLLAGPALFSTTPVALFTRIAGIDTKRR